MKPLHVGCMKVNNQHFPLLRKYKYPHFNNFVQLFHSFLINAEDWNVSVSLSVLLKNSTLHVLGEICSLYLSLIHSEVEVARTMEKTS